jgi:MoxR-like ATPase
MTDSSHDFFNDKKEENPLSSQPSSNYQLRVDISDLREAVNRIKREASKVIVGQHDLIDLMIAAILADGHVLIEGVPGIAKTLTAKIIAKSLNVDFQRIQFTPDLMPSDIIGTSVFNPKSMEFEYKRGPIFSNIVLIDEINRSPAKTQAALFEVMEEKQITIDGTTYKMEAPFLVFATQNPIDHEGTYSLPEAQTDRFIFKIVIDYPSLDQEEKILKIKNTNKQHLNLDSIIKAFGADDLAKYRDLIHDIHVKDELISYIAKIVNETRNNKSLYLGASPRASISLLFSSKAFAAMNGRDFVTPEDIQYMVYPVLRHRVLPTPEKEMEGVSVDKIIKDLLEKIEVPR